MSFNHCWNERRESHSEFFFVISKVEPEPEPELHKKSGSGYATLFVIHFRTLSSLLFLIFPLLCPSPNSYLPTSIRPRQLNKPVRLRTGRLMFARAARTAKRCNVSTRTLERHFRQRVNRRHRLPEWGRQLHNSIYLQ